MTLSPLFLIMAALQAMFVWLSTASYYNCSIIVFQAMIRHGITETAKKGVMA